MIDELTPPEKHHKHNVIIKYILIIISFFGSMIFVNILVTGSIIHHFYNKILGRYHFEEIDYSKNKHGYIPRQAYPDIKNLKIVDDIRYYALQLNLDLEEHIITTEDGYVLTLHHLIDPKESQEQRHSKKPVLFQHGLMSSSGAFFTSGFNSIPYYFHEKGYDVWLGNNRSYFQPKHTFYEHLYTNEQFWDWDIRALAYFDMPALIENVLTHKPNHSKLILAGHSQGGCQTFIMLRNPKLSHIHDKIEWFIPLAPACFPGPIFHRSGFLLFMHSLSETGFMILFGSCGFIRYLNFLRRFMATTPIYRPLSYYMFNYLFGWGCKNWDSNTKVWRSLMLFNVVHISTRLMIWYTSSFLEESFANQLLPKKAYKTGENHLFNPEAKQGPLPTPKKAYLPFENAWFDGSDHTVPIILFTGGSDDMVDGDRLITHLRHYEPKYEEGKNLHIFKVPDFSHLDLIWAVDAIDKIGIDTVNILQGVEKSGSSNYDTPAAVKVDKGKIEDLA
ncbi:Alpha/Beta hydrolase protein [Scheffersomyces amazonensis]|uniref:Alpha/Beta hydrolase protein n=1 Tax=Scheffersomyces amazonensis TaxID=1078765 RepID=UPI00315C540D